MNADVRFPGAPTVRPGVNAVTMEVAARYSRRGAHVPPPVVQHKPSAVAQQVSAPPSVPRREDREPQGVSSVQRAAIYLTEQRGMQCSPVTRVMVTVPTGSEVIGVLQVLFESPANRLAFTKSSHGKALDGEIEVSGSVVRLNFASPPWSPKTQCGDVARLQLLATLKGVGIRTVRVNVNGQRWENLET